MKDGLTKLDGEEIIHLVNELLNSVEDISACHEFCEIYTGFLNEIYPTDEN